MGHNRGRLDGSLIREKELRIFWLKIHVDTQKPYLINTLIGL